MFAWLRWDVEGNPKPLEPREFGNELGEPYRLFHRIVAVHRAEGASPHADVESAAELPGAVRRVAGDVPAHQPAVARPAARVRVAPGRARGAAGPGARPAGARVDHDDGAVRQPDAGEPAGGSGEAGAWAGCVGKAEVVREATARSESAPHPIRSGALSGTPRRTRGITSTPSCARRTETTTARICSGSISLPSTAANISSSARSCCPSGIYASPLALPVELA